MNAPVLPIAVDILPGNKLGTGMTPGTGKLVGSQVQNWLSGLGVSFSAEGMSVKLRLDYLVSVPSGAAYRKPEEEAGGCQPSGLITKLARVAPILQRHAQATARLAPPAQHQGSDTLAAMKQQAASGLLMHKSGRHHTLRRQLCLTSSAMASRGRSGGTTTASTTSPCCWPSLTAAWSLSSSPIAKHSVLLLAAQLSSSA